MLYLRAPMSGSMLGKTCLVASPPTRVPRRSYMALPRQIFPGTTHFVTRRTVQRTFLLRPSPKLNQIFLYCLGCAAERYGIEVHAYCLMSNHMHLVLTDPRGTLPNFMHWLDLFVAKCVNVMLGRWESVWADGSYTPVVLLGDPTIVEKIVYTLNNPVSAGLVRFGAQWPVILRSTSS